MMTALLTLLLFFSSFAGLRIWKGNPKERVSVLDILHTLVSSVNLARVGSSLDLTGVDGNAFN
jgi:hypothetical protein